MENNITKDRAGLVDYFNKPVCILDRRYSLVCVIDETLYLFELGKEFPSVWSFYDWHGPWKDNMDGKFLKHLQRISLGLSTSISGTMIPVKNMINMKDVISKEGNIMTDGAAPISREAMFKIARQLNMSSLPTAVQGRYDGAKGVWYLAPGDEDERNEKGMWIGIRDSQKKLQRNDTTEKCQQILDVLRPATVTTPSCLSKQILMILVHNGVALGTLINMQKGATICS